MNKILSKTQFSEKVFCIVVEAPLIARSCRPGQFIIVRVDENSERVPYTIAKSDPDKGTLTLVIQEVGLSSTKFCKLNEGDFVLDIVGPLGNPSPIETFGTVVCAGGGIGIAAILPILTALKKAGNKVISVLAGRTKNLIIMEDDVRQNSDEVIIMTDDGSYGQKGVVTVGVEEVIKREHVDRVIAIGPPMMMKFTSLMAQKYNIPNTVSLNTIMVDVPVCVVLAVSPLVAKPVSSALMVLNSTAISSTGTKCFPAWEPSRTVRKKRWITTQSTSLPMRVTHNLYCLLPVHQSLLMSITAYHPTLSLSPTVTPLGV